MTTSFSRVLAVVAIGALSAGAAMQAQRAGDDRREPPPTELLQEVRALRVAIERFTVAGARAQLLLGRLQMQEGRIATLSRQAQDVHARLGEMQRDRDANLSEIKALTGRLGEVAADERRALEGRLESMRRQNKRFDQRLQELEAEDASAAGALAAEQSRWVDLNNRLEELERTLAQQRQ
jgi:chromosome segregation ATPase